jgi:hypothetical protein
MTTLLAKYLSTLSTSAPAPSCSVGPSVFRQGTCDRGIWRKPLAFAADAGGAYGICFGVSKFVRVHDERQKEKRTANQFFSSLLESRSETKMVQCRDFAE